MADLLGLIHWMKRTLYRPMPLLEESVCGDGFAELVLCSSNLLQPHRCTNRQQSTQMQQLKAVSLSPVLASEPEACCPSNLTAKVNVDLLCKKQPTS